MKKVGSKAENKKKSEEENSSSEGKRIAAAMYSGLISHSDTSDDEAEPEPCLSKRNADKGLRSDDDNEIGEDDPDFNASDSPPDECESVS